MKRIVQDLKEAFGCRTDREFADLMGIKRPTVTLWKHGGIPALRWRHICAVAQAQQAELPESFQALMSQNGNSKDAA